MRVRITMRVQSALGGIGMMITATLAGFGGILPGCGMIPGLIHGSRLCGDGEVRGGVLLGQDGDLGGA